MCTVTVSSQSTILVGIGHGKITLAADKNQKMNINKQNKIKITVVGLGYVGLPLALALARKFSVIGYDSDPRRITELMANEDRTGEILAEELLGTSIKFTSELLKTSACDLFIVAVPTPIDDKNKPNLHALEKASREVGGCLSRGSVVVYESTVFPGATEDICGPILEEASGLNCGEDFYLGYSPERINPGDKDHAIDSVTKVVAGQTQEVTRLLASVYGTVIPAGIYVAPNIRTAEAAKVIENAQRDINIAFINEVTMIFHHLGLNTEDVLAAARTKWNFLDFRPGLVGGHCIGVDPYYLAYAAEKEEFKPEIILAGRRINDGMARYLAEEIDRLVVDRSRLLVMGLTFKENVSDLRNSQVIEVVRSLMKENHYVHVFDPVASSDDVKATCGLSLLPKLDSEERFDAVIGAVAHQEICDIPLESIKNLINPRGVLVDVKQVWPSIKETETLRVWRL